jgi:hypothetical protein
MVIDPSWVDQLPTKAESDAAAVPDVVAGAAVLGAVSPAVGLVLPDTVVVGARVVVGRDVVGRDVAARDVAEGVDEQAASNSEQPAMVVSFRRPLSNTGPPPCPSCRATGARPDVPTPVRQ